MHVVALACLLLFSRAAPGDDYAAEVYRDGLIKIHAGLAENGGALLQLGDVVELIVAVEYDPAIVSVLEPDETFFVSVLPESAGAVLAGWRIRHGPGRTERTSAMHAKFRFQFVACPDAAMTCPGSRTYTLPEFRLQYRRLDGDDASLSAAFRVRPETLIVSTAIARDEEDQLYPFEHYFPAGGYPEPLTGTDSGRASLMTAGVGLAILIGGMLMWPFRSERRTGSAAEQARWQALLNRLQDDDGRDEARLLDDLRRCLVWYCNDELKIDPFIWLDLAETGDEGHEEEDHAELRSLFVRLLHCPTGRGAELRSELQKLVRTQRGA